MNRTSPLVDVIESLAASSDKRLFAMSDDELAADWHWRWSPESTIEWNLYTFSRALTGYASRCRRWEERHNGHSCVVERVRDRYLMPRITEFLAALAQFGANATTKVDERADFERHLARASDRVDVVRDEQSGAYLDPAVEMAWLAWSERAGKAHRSRQFSDARLDLLQSCQRHFGEPERTFVCDILANGRLLPDPSGSRYGGLFS